jgi:hypothetical protein
MVHGNPLAISSSPHHCMPYLMDRALAPLAGYDSLCYAVAIVTLAVGGEIRTLWSHEGMCLHMALGFAHRDGMSKEQGDVECYEPFFHPYIV